jgi:hypothetical protein
MKNVANCKSSGIAPQVATGLSAVPLQQNNPVLIAGQINCFVAQNHVIELRLKKEVRAQVLGTDRYRLRDDHSLILEARNYVRGRLPVNDRETATAVLLGRDSVEDQLARLSVR